MFVLVSEPFLHYLCCNEVTRNFRWLRIDTGAVNGCTAANYISDLANHDNGCTTVASDVTTFSSYNINYAEGNKKILFILLSCSDVLLNYCMARGITVKVALKSHG